MAQKLDAFDRQIKAVAGDIKYSADRLNRLAQVKAYFQEFSSVVLLRIGKDVDSVSIWGGCLELRLKADRANSRLAHTLAQHFAVPFTKGQGYQSLTLTGYLPEGQQLREAAGIESVQISGYKPDTCKLVTTYTPFTEDEKAAKLAEIELGRATVKVECKPEESEIEPVAEAEPAEVDIPF